MDEYTLAPSTRDDDGERSLGRRLLRDGCALLLLVDAHSPRAKAWLRLVNGAAHLGLASVLLAIMGEFMVRSNRLGRAQRWVLGENTQFHTHTHTLRLPRLYLVPIILTRATPTSQEVYLLFVLFTTVVFVLRENTCLIGTYTLSQCF